MKALSLQPNLVEQVTQALLEEVISGQLKPGERIIQEQIAQALGVSRQPVQQALMLLRNQGMLQDAPGRGLIVATLDPAHVRHIYEIRAAIEALAQTAALLSFESMGEQPDDNTVVYFVGIDGARFKRVVEPGDQLVLEASVERAKAGIYKYKVRASVDGETAVEAELMCTMRKVD